MFDNVHLKKVESRLKRGKTSTRLGFYLYRKILSRLSAPPRRDPTGFFELHWGKAKGTLRPAVFRKGKEILSVPLEVRETVPSRIVFQEDLRLDQRGSFWLLEEALFL